MVIIQLILDWIRQRKGSKQARNQTRTSILVEMDDWRLNEPSESD